MKLSRDLTRICAEAFGFEVFSDQAAWRLISASAVACKMGIWAGECIVYDPANNDGQAMQLVREFGLSISRLKHGSWLVQWFNPMGDEKLDAIDADLNIAICACVVKIQRQKQAA